MRLASCCPVRSSPGGRCPGGRRAGEQRQHAAPSCFQPFEGMNASEASEQPQEVGGLIGPVGEMETEKQAQCLHARGPRARRAGLGVGPAV